MLEQQSEKMSQGSLFFPQFDTFARAVGAVIEITTGKAAPIPIHFTASRRDIPKTVCGHNSLSLASNKCLLRNSAIANQTSRSSN
jgi:hypothetical protein